jgi:hypothetical protein
MAEIDAFRQLFNEVHAACGLGVDELLEADDEVLFRQVLRELTPASLRELERYLLDRIHDNSRTQAALQALYGISPSGLPH